MEIDVRGPAVRGLSRARIRSFVGSALRSIRKRVRNLPSVDTISIALVTDADMRRINRRFRGRNKTTDVLTFGMDREPDPTGARSLGEIVISIEQAARQARAERHSLPTEIRYLIVHGLLHAFDFDHETDQGEMDELEIKVRHALALD